MATQEQIAAAVAAIEQDRKENLERWVRIIAGSIETPAERTTDMARPCTEIIETLQAAAHLFAEIGDSQGRSIGITLSRRAFQAESRCRAAVRSLRSLIEDA